MKLSTLSVAVILTGLSLTNWQAAHASPAGVNARVSARVMELNKMQARRVYEEGLSQGRFEVPYTADFVGRGGGKATFTHEQGMKEAKGWRQAFPDLNVVVDLVVAEGDLVSVRWTAKGTNSAPGMGLPVTGKYVETSGITMFRFVDGAIAEEWTAGDAMGLMRQLGLLGGTPSPRPAQ